MNNIVKTTNNKKKCKELNSTSTEVWFDTKMTLHSPEFLQCCNCSQCSHLSCVVCEEEVVAQQDDGGEELPEAGLVLVAGQQLCQACLLHKILLGLEFDKLDTQSVI